MSWREQAACLDHPHPEWWLGQKDADASRRQGKAACGSCPVRDECLEDALEVEARLGFPTHGVYGGLDEAERRKVIRYRLARGGPGAKVLPDTGHARPVRHGTQYSYQAHRCRCGECRAAHAATVAGWRKRRDTGPQPGRDRVAS